MAEEAWGKWGKEDERGALNYVSADEVRRAAKLVRSGKVFSLAQPLSPETPVPNHRGPMQHFMQRDGGDYAAGGKRPGGFQFAEDTVVMALQFGTHIDALCHAWHDDKLYNGFSSHGTRSTTRAARCGVEKMGPIVTRGLLLDVLDDGKPLAKGAPVTRWIETMLADPHYYDGEPGIDVEAGRWLADKGVAVIGSDNFAIEHIPFPKDTVFPVHQLVIRGYGVPLLEGLVLAPLAAAGATEFLFVAGPLPFVGGTGSPLMPIAIL
jgi:kynurenine formamidase